MLALMIPIAVDSLWPRDLHEESLGFATIVVGDWVPTFTAPTGLALLAGLAAVIAAPVVGSWNTGDRDTGMTIRVISSLSVVILALSAILAWTGIWFADRQYVALGDRSASGCQIIGAEGSSGFHRTATSFGVVQPGATRVEWSVTNATTRLRVLDEASVTWAGDVGTIETDHLDDVIIRCTER